MSRDLKPQRGSATSTSARQGWDAPDEYVSKAVASAVGNSSNAILTDGHEVAPSVTVYTNIAGAVAVTVDQAGRENGRRLRSKLLPENLFNPFRVRSDNKTQNIGSTNTDSMGKGAKDTAPSHAETDQDHVRSSVAACIAAEGIKDGVRQALDQWALKTCVLGLP